MDSELHLEDIPKDGISKLQFGKTTDNLIATSWDSTLSLYDGYSAKLKTRYQGKAAILAADFTQDETGVYIGGLEQKVRKVDFATNEETDLGHHDDVVRWVEFDPYSNCLYTGSWDKTLKIWDERSSNKETVRELSDKVYSLTTCRNKVICAMANNNVVVYDTRSSRGLEYEDETSLGKYQIRTVQGMPDGEGYAWGSVEGRIAIEYFPDTVPEGCSNFSYKCHRVSKEEDGSKYSYIYPVNDISFHPRYKTFASCGSDGMLNTWDPNARKRIWKKQFDCGITCVSFNKDGSKLAVGISYNHDNDVDAMQDIPKPDICILGVNDTIAKPKAKK